MKSCNMSPKVSTILAPNPNLGAGEVLPLRRWYPVQLSNYYLDASDEFCKCLLQGAITFVRYTIAYHITHRKMACDLFCAELICELTSAYCWPDILVF